MNETQAELEKRVEYLEKCILEDKPVGFTEKMKKHDYIVAGVVTAAFFLLVVGGAFL